MPRKSTKKTLKPVRPQLGDGVEILNAGSVLEDPITRTLETNYMPYAMSVIVSRALALPLCAIASYDTRA
jgi:DNA gyrase subunit A